MSSPYAMLELLQSRAGLAAMRVPTLEELLTGREYFGLTTASPLQRAICRIADGRPLGDLARHPHVVGAIGDVDSLPSERPDELCVVSGIRTAKSLLAAAASVRAALTCDLSQLGAGEQARVSVVSTRLDLAHAVFGHIVGNLTGRKGFEPFRVGKPTSDSIEVRHPSGQTVEIKVVAGSMGGTTLTARWCAGVVFDEAPRMVGAGEGVVNLDDMRSSVIGRLLPGAMVWTIGSPWAPFGPVYRMVSDHEGKPSARLVVVRAPGYWMNPVWWNESRCAKLRDSKSRTDQLAYITDVEAKFADVEEALIATSQIDACVTRNVVETAAISGHHYYAAMDPATRGNAWTLVVGTKAREGKRVIVLARQWQGTSSAPLDPERVLTEIRDLLAPYGLRLVETDQWSTDALQSIAKRVGIGLTEWPATGTDNTQMYLAMASLIADGAVSLPDEPLLIDDLKRLKRTVTQAGVSIALPKSSDGRHCDYVPSLARVLRRHLNDPVVTSAAPGKASAEEAAILERLTRRANGRAKPFWKR